ncbi:unnamed protein product [Caenorhabditis angaria]|uniref:Uncharacterized protein n=1 Tax=Caenorhabditis angaria TaxID=860376 RepID=A0A9P1MZH2_9PELO|nr:unnamed protein product [Caenorhabditis angaria]
MDAYYPCQSPPIKPKIEDKDIMEGEKEKVEDNDGMHLVFVILPAALIIIWVVLIFVVLVLCKMSKRKREARASQHYSRTWKTPTTRETLPSRNPNIIYGRTPRITTYEGY